MDTKTLVVGQDIYIVSGCYCKKGKVVKVIPSGVEVFDLVEIFQFDTRGKGCDNHRGEYGAPWEIDEMPVAERTALWEQGARDWRAKVIETNRRPR
jgi:hypothetical protein